MILFFIGGWEDMARKAYSEEDRVQVRNALMTTMIQCIADRGLIHSSIDVLCRKVEISKTFIYSYSHPRKNWCSTPCDTNSPNCWIMPDP